MAERLPVVPARNVKSPSIASFGSNPCSNDVNYASIDRLNIQTSSPEADLTASNNQLLSNGSSTVSNRSAGHNKQGQSDSTNRNGSRTKDCESRSESEWVEQDEPGVYITLTSLPGGKIELKRVRFRYAVFYGHIFSAILHFTSYITSHAKFVNVKYCILLLWKKK